MSPSRRTRIDRRRLLTSSAIGGAAILGTGQPLLAGTRTSQSATIPAQDDSADVPMFLGNAARTGEMPGPGPDDSNGVAAIWRFTATDEEENFSGALAVVDGVVFVGSDAGVLYAVNAEDGAERWRFTPTDDWIIGTAIVEGVVFVGSAGSEGGVLYAVNAKDGAERWRFSIPDGDSSVPSVANGVVYIGSKDGVLYAMNAEDGAERWRFTATDEYLGIASVADGVVYVGSVGDDRSVMYAVNADDGTERWRFTATVNPFGYLAVADGVVYAGSNGDDGSVMYAVNADDGTERWRFTPTGDTYGMDYPAVVDGTVYIGSGGGNLYAVSTEDGAERWSFSVVDGIYPEAVAGGMVYATSGGDLLAIGAKIPILSVGGTARVTETTHLRGGPASTTVERAELVADTIVNLTGESEQTGDVTWWPVSVDETGDQGWVEASKLEPLTSGPEPTVTP